VPISPDDSPVWNPAFDITPAELITEWVTEEGLWTPPGRL
jgi:methylthioribose-1-phosphate isomerase